VIDIILLNSPTILIKLQYFCGVDRCWCQNWHISTACQIFDTYFDYL